jgi:hypothetical protein
MNPSYSRSATFLFPLLEVPKNLFECSVKSVFNKILFTNRFLNTYLYDKEIDNYRENYLFLLVRNYRDVNFDLFYSSIIAYPNYIEDYEVGECIVFIFSIPEKFKKDYNLILEGKYSLISEEAKKRIVLESFYNFEPILIPLILNKDSSLKNYWENKLSYFSKDINSPADLANQEVFPIIDRKKEILSKEIYNLYNKKKKLDCKGE